MLLLAGATIAPTEATVYAMVDGAAPAGGHDRGVRLARHGDRGRRRTRSRRRRRLADRAGPTAAFALAGGAGAIAVLTALPRSRTLLSRQAPAIAGTGTATATATGTVSIDARALAPAADRPDPRRLTVSLDVITQSSATVTERLPAVGPTLPGEGIEAVAPVPGRCPLASADSARICCCG